MGLNVFTDRRVWVGNPGRVTVVDWSLIVPRKVNFMVSLKSYRIQLSSASCNYKSKMNFQKMASFIFSKCLVHAMIGGRGFRTCVWKNLRDFPQLQANIKLIRRYEGW